MIDCTVERTSLPLSPAGKGCEGPQAPNLHGMGIQSLTRESARPTRSIEVLTKESTPRDSFD